ncbi:hypothetical protein CHLRE_04g232303v5 [Chlamydomonas reinhardtii]|uniref:Uncharacterized protein n=1 Tax=Chlamydomonas reinhardtii TaxID=3055 RepID=A0A2K3DUY7_CHLRE|nr:uncharacterized protein CHLRE_04g232303v5 [Chlamydomonas reinhardtii]PNW84360.1 hypothetical protein CHLRE_04g232303v5 [Chlamydomonas reinhardtii]
MWVKVREPAGDVAVAGVAPTATAAAATDADAAVDASGAGAVESCGSRGFRGPLVSAGVAPSSHGSRCISVAAPAAPVVAAVAYSAAAACVSSLRPRRLAAGCSSVPRATRCRGLMPLEVQPQQQLSQPHQQQWGQRQGTGVHPLDVGALPAPADQAAAGPRSRVSAVAAPAPVAVCSGGSQSGCGAGSDGGAAGPRLMCAALPRLSRRHGRLHEPRQLGAWDT